MEQEINSQEDAVLAALFAQVKALPVSTVKSERLIRFYDVFVRDIQGESVITAYNARDTYASRLRNKYRQKHGYRVDLLEIGVSGEIHRTPEIPIDYTPVISTVGDKPFTREKGMKQREINFLRKRRQQILSQANAKLAKENKDKNIRVYDKLTNQLSYSGTIEGAIDYIIDRQEFGNWNENSWVIYIPQKIYNQVVR